jgi:hypothetical protein
MPERITPLSEVKVRTVKPQENEYKLFDGGGLFLLVTPSGGKLWHFKYRFDNKEKKLTCGTYPEISLLDARKLRDEARTQLANGIDPGTVRKAQKQAKTESTETFEVIAREWHGRFTQTWTTGHADTIMSRLERDLFPWIGKRPIAEIKAPELLSVMRKSYRCYQIIYLGLVQHFLHQGHSTPWCYLLIPKSDLKIHRNHL